MALVTFPERKVTRRAGAEPRGIGFWGSRSDTDCVLFGYNRLCRDDEIATASALQMPSYPRHQPRLIHRARDTVRFLAVFK